MWLDTSWNGTAKTDTKTPLLGSLALHPCIQVMPESQCAESESSSHHNNSDYPLFSTNFLQGVCLAGHAAESKPRVHIPIEAHLRYAIAWLCLVRFCYKFSLIPLGWCSLANIPVFQGGWQWLHAIWKYRSVPHICPPSRISPPYIFSRSSCTGIFISQIGPPTTAMLPK